MNIAGAKQQETRRMGNGPLHELEDYRHDLSNPSNRIRRWGLPKLD